MKPTIYDVAEKAGVSIATVSKVINKTGKIGDKTKQKVNRIMKEINYQPSMVASALTGKRTNTIGLLIPDIANPFFAELARHIEDRGQEEGFNVVMCNTDDDPDKEAQYLQWLRQKSVDGIILATGVQTELTLKELTEQKLPFALIARDLPSLAVDTVLIDDYLGGYQATSHLIECGYKEILSVTTNQESYSERERLRGYHQALADAGLPFKEELILKCKSTIEAGYETIQTYLKKSNKENPKAVFAFNDLIAIGIINGARDSGLKVPEELAVVGFDNTILATVSTPPLTTVAQPIADMGIQVINLLVESMREEQRSKRRIVLTPELVIRGTTKNMEQKELGAGTSD